MDHVRTDPCCAAEQPTSAPRDASLTRALRLEYLTVGWNVVEGVIAVAAALAAGSVALLGFGLDSFVESASGAVMIWRLRAERLRRLSRADVEALEQRARRLVAASLVVLGAYVAFDAVQTIWANDRPEFSVVGVVLTSVSLGVMWWLARAKRAVE